MSKSSAEQGPDRRLETAWSYSIPEPAPAPDIEDELRRAERLIIEGDRAGLDDFEMGTRLGDMARICFARHAYAEAVPPLTRLLSLNRAHGEDRAEVATVLSSLAAAHYALGEHNEAAQLWEEALHIREQRLVPNHFMIARSLEHLADARVAQGRIDEALTLLRRALSVWQQTLPPGDPTVRAIRTKIGDLQLLSWQELPDREPAPARHEPVPFPSMAPPRIWSYTPEPPSVDRAQSAPPQSFDAPGDPKPEDPTAEAPVGASEPIVLETTLDAREGGTEASGEPELTSESQFLSGDSRLVYPILDSAPDIAVTDGVVLYEVAEPVEEPVTEPVEEPAAESFAESSAESFADVAPAVVHPDVPLPSPVLADLEAPLHDEPTPTQPAADREKPPVAPNWLLVGRLLAQSAPEPAVSRPIERPSEEEERVEALRMVPVASSPRHPRVIRVAGPIVLALALFAMYRLAGSAASPAGDSASMIGVPVGGAPEGSVARAPASIVRGTSAGSVAPAADRRVTTPARAVAREAARSRASTSAGPATTRDPRGESAPAASLTPMPAAASAQLADAMKTIDAGTVAGADSGVRHMLYGGALALDAGRVAPGASSPASAAATRATPEDAADMKSAMLAPGGEPPVFPFQLLSENVTGSVVLEVLVDADGRPDTRTARVVRSSHPLFTSSVMRALPTMRFVPAEAHGRKVSQRIEVPFRFDRKTAGQ